MPPLHVFRDTELESQNSTTTVSMRRATDMIMKSKTAESIERDIIESCNWKHLRNKIPAAQTEFQFDARVSDTLIVYSLIDKNKGLKEYIYTCIVRPCKMLESHGKVQVTWCE